MAAPDYNRQGSIYVPAIQPGVSGQVGGPLVTIYSNSPANPSATGAIILDRAILPKNLLDVAGQYVYVTACATIVNNANNKTLAINFGGTGSVGGAVTGGTTVATVTQAGAGAGPLYLHTYVWKTGASTQGSSSFAVATATPSITVASPAETDTANIQLNLIVNAATAASDITNVRWIVQYGA